MKGRARRPLRLLVEILVLTVVLPLLILGLLEGGIRLARIDTEYVSLKGDRIRTPVWAAEDENAFVAADVLHQILTEDLPAEAAEWLRCFEVQPAVHYRLKPGRAFRVTNTVNRMEIRAGLKVEIRASREGFRTPDRPRTKPAGTYRILVLGDSTAFGWGVEESERWSDLLAQALAAVRPDRKVEVVNMALPGYSSWHGRAVLERYGLAYEPDLMILSFGANDARTLPARLKRLVEHPDVFDRLSAFLSRFKIYQAAERALSKAGDPESRRESQHRTQDFVPFSDLDEFRANLKAMIEAGRARNCRTILLALCCPLDYLAAQSALAKREDVTMLDGSYILLQSVAEIQAGRREPSLARHFEELYGAALLKERRILYVTNDSCHPNALGHRVLADALMERVFAGGKD